MAEAEQEKLSLKTSFGEVAAKGATVVLLIALAAIGALALREHTKREAAEHLIVESLNRQNDLLHQQTADLSAQIEEIKCNLGIDIFVHQFPRGTIEWDLLPVQLHGCYPDVKKMPRKEIR